jgi:hypothetical protein
VRDIERAYDRLERDDHGGRGRRSRGEPARQEPTPASVAVEESPAVEPAERPVPEER